MYVFYNYLKNSPKGKVAEMFKTKSSLNLFETQEIKQVKMELFRLKHK